MPHPIFFCQLRWFFFFQGRTRNIRKENSASQANNRLPKHFPSSICLSSEKHTRVICSPEGLCAIRGRLRAGRHRESSRTGLIPQSTIPARPGAAGGTRAAPALDTRLAPPWDGMLPAKGCVSCDLATHSQPGAAPKAAPKSQIQHWLQPPSLIPPLQRFILGWSENPQKPFISNHAHYSHSSYCRKAHLRRTCACMPEILADPHRDLKAILQY